MHSDTTAYRLLPFGATDKRERGPLTTCDPRSPPSPSDFVGEKEAPMSTDPEPEIDPPFFSRALLLFSPFLMLALLFGLDRCQASPF